MNRLAVYSYLTRYTYGQSFTISARNTLKFNCVELPGQLRDTAHATRDTTPRAPFPGSDVRLITARVR